MKGKGSSALGVIDNNDDAEKTIRIEMEDLERAKVEREGEGEGEGG